MKRIIRKFNLNPLTKKKNNMERKEINLVDMSPIYIYCSLIIRASKQKLGIYENIINVHVEMDNDMRVYTPSLLFFF